MARIQRTLLDVLMLDGTEHIGTVITVADQMRLSDVAKRHKWDIGDGAGQVKGSIFLAWASLNRTGQFTGTFDEFVQAAETVAQNEGGVHEVDPTQLATPTV